MYSASTPHARFPHRDNQDGSIDSICPRCFVTVGTSSREADLERIEASHVCDPAILTHYQEQSETTKKQPSRQESPLASTRRLAGE